MAVKSTTGSVTIDIVEIQRGSVTYRIVGETPLIMERMSEKAKRDLLLGTEKPTAVERREKLKHIPRDEFRQHAHVTTEGPTLLFIPGGAIKAAIANAALRMPGVRKTEVEQLTHIVAPIVSRNGVPVWGVPRLLMSSVRSSDINRTPDIRTRPILAHWATEITVRYVKPNLTPQGISRLLVGAGAVAGLLGWRPEKGGDYGRFEVVAEDDDRWDAIVLAGGREAQERAMAEAVPFDDESAELLDFFDTEIEKRHKEGRISDAVFERATAGSVDVASRENGHAYA